MSKRTKNSRLGRLDPKIIEREAEYIEKILQPEILSANSQKENTMKTETAIPAPGRKRGLRRFFK